MATQSSRLQMPVTEPLYWEGGAHFQNWYPVCVSKNLPQGKLHSREFLNTRIIIYRDPDGKAVVQSSYCPHLGADLSDGEIVEGQVRCPYHHWRFASDGFCSHIPTGVKPPRAARIFNYPAAEKWGLIWAFNGPEPLYEVPSFDGPEEDYVFSASERAVPIESDAWMGGTNGLDFQHLTAVHHMPDNVHSEPRFDKYTIEYELMVFSPEGKNRMYGASTLVAHKALPLPFPTYVIFSGTPDSPTQSTPFVVAAVKREPDESQEAAEARVKVLEDFLVGFVGEDEYILNKIRFRLPGKAKLIKDDVYLAKFFKWLDEFPKHRPFDT